MPCTRTLRARLRQWPRRARARAGWLYAARVRDTLQPDNKHLQNVCIDPTQGGGPSPRPLISEIRHRRLDAWFAGCLDCRRTPTGANDAQTVGVYTDMVRRASFDPTKSCATRCIMRASGRRPADSPTPHDRIECSPIRRRRICSYYSGRRRMVRMGGDMDN